MRNILIIARREMKSHFNSPVAYIVITSFLFISGWIFFSSFFLMGRADMRSFFSPAMLSPSMLLVILVPAVTMRLISEERKTGTIELLTTLPVTDLQVIVGKFLGAMVLLATAAALTGVYSLSVAYSGDLDWGPVISGYFGFILFIASMTSIGLFCSTLTENQITAFILGFIICAVLYFIKFVQFFLPQSLASFVEYISISSHLGNLARGVIDSRDVLYYLTIIIVSLLMSVRSLERQHA